MADPGHRFRRGVEGQSQLPSFPRSCLAMAAMVVAGLAVPLINAPLLAILRAAVSPEMQGQDFNFALACESCHQSRAYKTALTDTAFLNTKALLMMTSNSTQEETAKTKRPFRARMGRWLSLTALVLLALFLLLFAFDRIASAVEVRRFPPAGEMVNVGTHSLHLHCQGNGSPTVLVEAGSGSWSLDWRTAQEQIAQSTRVCVYERAGYGWSEAGPMPRTGSQIVNELHTLVTNAGLERPFVLVAHSFGGLPARIYADRYPDDIAGLVLLDTRHEDFSAAAPREVAVAEEGAASTLQVGLMLERTGLIRVLGPLLAPPPQDLPETLHPLYRAQFYQDKFLRALANEGHAMATTEAEAAQTGNLGDTPLIVVTHDPQHPIVMPGLPADVNQQAEDLWWQTQQEMTNLSSDSRLIVAEGSGHNIHVDRPDLVSDVVTQMIALVRG